MCIRVNRLTTMNRVIPSTWAAPGWTGCCCPGSAWTWRDKVTPDKMGSTYTINGAKVVCGDVTTANATVCIINSVLMPES